MHEVKPIKDCSQEYEKIAESLSRYIKFVLFENKNESDSKNKILFIPVIKNISIDENTDFTDTTPENSENDSSKLEGILFFTAEELARGDESLSFLNKSRMIRSFFERTTHAVTANHNDILIKLRELICDIELKEGKATPEKALSQLSELKSEADNLAKTNFNDNKKKHPDFFNDYWEEMKKLYTYQSFHTRSSHYTYRNIEKDLNAGNQEEFLQKSLNLRFEEFLYDLAFTVAWNPLRLNEKLKIMIIDDNPSESSKDWKNLLNLFPNNTECYITIEDIKWDHFIENDFLLRESCKIRLKKIVRKGLSKKNYNKLLIEDNKFIFTHVIVDLLIGNYNEGNKIIRNLLRLRHKLGKEKIDAKFEIIACSLSEEIEDIHRALQEGAIAFVPKKRIFSLPGIISRLEDSRKNLPGKKSTIAKYRNLGKLYQLPERIKRKLQTEPFAKFSDDKNKKKYLNNLSKELAFNWIKKVPKAELHYHIGGSMNADMVFNLALNSIWHKNEEWKSNKSEEIGESIKSLINTSKETFSPYIEKLISDEYINREHEIFLEHKKEFKETIFDCRSEKVKKAFLDKVELWKKSVSTDLNEKELFLITEILSIDEPNKWAEEISDITDEKLFFKFITWKIKEKLKDKIKPDEIKEEDIINFFIVLVGLLERKDKNVKKFWKLVENLKKELNEIYQETNIQYINFAPERFNSLLNILKNNIKKYNNLDILHNLISSKNRKGSLKNYLRGSTFCGAFHLQYYENIFACVAHLVNEAAEDNIRYLEIRVSPEGYTKKDLTTNEAIQALFDGADCMSRYLYKKEKFIWVNFIITAKRHKTPDKMAIEISSAITNRKRTIMKEESLKKIQNKLHVNKLTAFGYEWKQSSIVGVDLAGWEKDFKPAQFEEDFAPLFKTCSFITIHAGEEGTAQNIWEAVYKLNAHRIGHGLKLTDHKFLLDLAKNTQICIEMAPISNVSTNPKLEENYPLYDYIKKGLCITINTDDKAWSDSSLSDEYVKAAELYWKRAKMKNLENEFLTKWEVLRVVKNGFKKAFIDREEVRELLKAVEEEICQLILESEKIEKETLPL